MAEVPFDIFEPDPPPPDLSERGAFGWKAHRVMRRDHCDVCVEIAAASEPGAYLPKQALWKRREQFSDGTFGDRFYCQPHASETKDREWMEEEAKRAASGLPPRKRGGRRR